MTVKLCENCINDVKTPQEQPCLDCRKGSGWVSKNVGCEFCKGEVNMWGFSGKVAGEVKIEIWEDESQDRDSDFYLNIDVMQDEENFKINYCPMCGRKLRATE